jgi:protein tyrosine phosphatase
LSKYLLKYTKQKGYSRDYSFIITQDPLPETVHEFWRMFIEHDCSCIVQLHTIIEVRQSVDFNCL